MLTMEIYNFVGKYSVLSNDNSGLRMRGSIPGGCWEFFSKPPPPERLWGLLSNGYQGLFPWG
jgi:hypothetical protein